MNTINTQSTKQNTKTTVVVGISGGVDSSVAALLLKQQGYNVLGVFMKNWEEDDEKDHCSVEEDLGDAQAVCSKIGIPLSTVNFSHEYLEQVFSYFLTEYQAGRTPNPDILCNKEIKFKAFLEHAKNLGADFIATGHYARKLTKGSANYPEFFLAKGIDNDKDQTYFLYTLNQEQLKYSLFPIGELQKSTVRQIAKDHNLITHNKKDSTGICFIGERKFKQFLAQYLPAKPGEIYTINGDKIGNHDGLMYYTLGQRQGLNIGGIHGSSGEAWYVISKDLKHNKLIVGQGVNNPLLYSIGLLANSLHFVSHTKIDKNTTFHCKAKTRYRQIEQPCTVTFIDDNTIKVIFDTPQRATTPGQSVVFYQDDLCLGGGVIINII